MFKIVSFNIRFGLADDGPNSWTNRRGLVASVLRNLSPDLVGLQEALDFQLADLAPLLPEHRIDGNHGDEDGVWRNCCALLYRPDKWRLLDVQTFWLSETPDVHSKSWDSKWPRRCTVGRYRCVENDRELWHFNTHLDFEEPAQINGVAVIWKKVMEWTGGDSVILTGDFNTFPESRVWKFLVGREEYMGLSPDFGDAWSAIHGAEKVSTYSGYGRVSCKDRVDWILYRGNIRAVDSYVVVPPPGGPYPSDHFPVVAEMEWIV